MAVKKKPPKNIVKTRMVGLQYRLSKQARQMLATHAPFKVKLEREPHNTKDENAIAVWTLSIPQAFHDMQLGYVKKEVAAVLSPVLDAEDVTITEATITLLHAIEGEGDLTIRLAKA